MADKKKYLSNDDTQNYYFSRLQLVVGSHSTEWTKQLNE